MLSPRPPRCPNLTRHHQGLTCVIFHPEPPDIEPNQSLEWNRSPSIFFPKVNYNF